MLNILYIINLVFCIPISLIYVVRTCKEEFIDNADSLSEKFLLSLLTILFLFVGMITAVIPIVGTILCIAYALKLYEEYKNYIKNNDKKEKKSKKKQSIEDLYYEIKRSKEFNFIPYNYNYDHIEELIMKVFNKYREISKTDFSSKLVENRIETVLNIIKHSIDNNLFNTNSTKNNKDFIKDMKEMLLQADTFFDEILQNIKDNEDQVKEEIENFMRSKIKNFIDTTKEMEKDFKEINKKRR